MEFTAQEIANFVEGTIEGNPKAVVRNFARIEQAQKGCLSFMANPKYEDHLYTTEASVLIVADNLELKHPIAASLVRVPDPYAAFAKLLEEYNLQITKAPTGISQAAIYDDTIICGNDVYIGPLAYIGKDVILEEGVQIHPQAYIGDNVRVGKNTIVHTGVKIYHQCQVGSNCILHASTVIGSDGFGFAPKKDGSFKKIPQIGNVIIGNDVEIGSNCSVDRATMGSTVIKDGVKLDNLIQVAHNVIIEENTVIAAQTGISGSTEIGPNCMIGGQVGFVGHIKIAKGSKINAQSGVTKNITKVNSAWNGTPAREFRESYKTMAHVQQIPQLKEQIKMLQAQLYALKEKLG